MGEFEADDRSAVDRALRAYAAAFAHGDAAAAARWCHVPFVLVTADEVSVAATAEEVQRGYTAALDTDADTGQIVASVLTDREADDGSQVGPLLGRVDGSGHPSPATVPMTGTTFTLRSRPVILMWQ